MKETPTTTDVNAIYMSKWYKQLADEQREDGSWGRFHSQDSKAALKQKFVTTENALGRACQLSLSKDDTIIAKCLRKLERYVRGDETWTDNIEKHKDGGKGHLFCRPYMSAAVINTFNPENPFIKPLRDNALESLEKAFGNDIIIPASYNIRYAESWRDKNNRKSDVILRLLRVLVKC
ncbi:MAG: hypothetical protein ABFD25_11025 [Clostridiaceae bacterium]